MTSNTLTPKPKMEKIWDIIKSIDFAMMLTDLKKQPIHVVPMSTKEIDTNGSIWFLSGKNSTHNQSIRKKGFAQLIYTDPKSMKFLSLSGFAKIVLDNKKLKSLFGKTDDKWFDGIDDPNLTAIKIIPEEAHYWDTKDNKLIPLSSSQREY